jgi:hypothetical protein
VEARKVGRPSKGDKAKRAPLNMKTTPRLRERMQRAADANGRALTQEVEARLDRSLDRDDQFGGQHVATFVDLLGMTIRVIEGRHGARWIDDPGTFDAVEAASLRLLGWNRPREPDVHYVKMAEVHRAWDAAHAAHDAATNALDDYRGALGVTSRGGIEPPAWPPAPAGPFAGAARTAADPRAGWTDAQRQEEARLKETWRQANAAVMAAGRATAAAWAAIAARRGEAKAAGGAIAEEMFKVHGPRGGVVGRESIEGT